MKKAKGQSVKKKEKNDKKKDEAINAEAANAAEIEKALEGNAQKDGFSHNLKPLRLVHIHKNAKTYLPGTYDWLLTEVENWYNEGEYPIFHIEGAHGVGKTVFCCQLTERFHAQMNKSLKSKEIHVGASFFFSRLNKLENDIRTFIRSVSDQLRVTVPRFKEVIKKQTGVDEFMLRKDDVFTMWNKLVAEPLRQTKNKTRYVIVVDALDEARPQFLESLMGVLFRWDKVTPKWLKILITSVDRSYVSRKMRLLGKSIDKRPKLSTMLNIGNDHRDELLADMKLVAENKLKDRLDAEQIDEAVDTCVKKAGGKLLYLRFLNELMELSNNDHRNLPQGLSKAYVQLFTNLRKKLGKEQYSEILSVLVATRQPIALSVWKEVASMEAEWDEVRDLFKPFTFTYANQKVFAHHTILEWLSVKKRMISRITTREVFSAHRDTNSKRLTVTKKSGHRLLSNFCWEGVKVDMKEGPKKTYAFENVIYHLTHDGRIEDASSLLKDFDWNLKRMTLNKTQGKGHKNVSRMLQDAFDIFLGVAPDDRGVRMLQNVINKGRSALHNDPRQFASQVLGRIRHKGLILLDEELNKLIGAAKSYVPGPDVQWWKPVNTSLERVDVLKTMELNVFDKKISSLEVDQYTGQKMAAACMDGSVRVFETKRGIVVYTFDKHRRNGGKVLSLSFNVSAAGELLLATGGTDGNVFVYSLEDGTILKEIKVGKKRVACVAFRPDEKPNFSYDDDDNTDTEYQTSGIESGNDSDTRRSLLAVGGRDGLRLYKDYEPLGEVILFGNQNHDITSLSWSHTRRGTVAAATASGYIFVYDTKTELTTSLTHGGRVNDISFHPTENLLLSAGEDKIANLWNVDDGSIAETYDDVHKSPLLCIQFSQGGNHFAVGGEDGSVAIVQTKKDGYSALRDEWKAQGPKDGFDEEGYLKSFREYKALPAGHDGAKLVLEGHKSAVVTLSYFPKSNRLVTGSKDKSLQFWSYHPKDLPLEEKLKHTQKIILALFSPDGSMLATAAKDKKLIIWDTKTGAPIKCLYEDSQIYTLNWSPDGECIGFTPDNGLEAWKNVKNGRSAPAPETKQKIKANENNKQGLTDSGLTKSGLTKSGLTKSGLTTSGLSESGLTDSRKKIDEKYGRKKGSVLDLYITKTPLDENGVAFTIDRPRDERLPLRFANLKSLEEDRYSEDVYCAVCENERVHILHLVTAKPENA